MNRTRRQRQRTNASHVPRWLVAVVLMVTACGGTDDSATSTPDTSVAAAPTLSLAQATTDIKGIVDAFNTTDLSYIDTLLGSDGVWVGINGGEWQGPMASERLRPLLNGITLTEILGEGVLVADGWAFPLREFRGARTVDYTIVVGRNADDSALVTEEWTIPPPVVPPLSCAAPTPGAHDVVMTVDGKEQKVRVFVPSAADGTVLPTVIDWHASGESASIQEATSGYEVLAEAEDFVVAHPEFWTPAYEFNAPDEIDAEREATALAYANALIDELVANWCADPARVYSTGFSLGSLFTARLVCTLSDRIAAAVSVDGIFHADDCTPPRAVPYMAFHGTLDPVLPFDSTVEAKFGGDPDFLAQVPLDEFAEFAADAGCEPTSVETTVDTEVVQHDYVGCDDGTTRTFFEIVGGGHTWPGSDGEAARWAGMGIGETTEQINATKVGWDFMRHHHLT